MQSFPDLADKDNDAIPAKELLAAGIKIRFMEESLRWRNLPGETPTVVYGKIGPFIFTREHTSWCVTRTDLKSLPMIRGDWASGYGFEYATKDVYATPSGWKRQCYRVYTPRALKIIAAVTKYEEKCASYLAEVELYNRMVKK